MFYDDGTWPFYLDALSLSAHGSRPPRSRECLTGRRASARAIYVHARDRGRFNVLIHARSRTFTNGSIRCQLDCIPLAFEVTLRVFCFFFFCFLFTDRVDFEFLLIRTYPIIEWFSAEFHERVSIRARWIWNIFRHVLPCRLPGHCVNAIGCKIHFNNPRLSTYVYIR